jgi:geranylgeranyl pyrophosphate synthase
MTETVKGLAETAPSLSEPVKGLTKAEFILWKEAYVSRLNEALAQAMKIPEDESSPEVGNLFSAMNHTVKSGGKRLRGLMVLAACEAVGGQEEWALPGALAVEMAHAYSLIHDDLPALDNDDLRRGQPTCHLVYGEAVAILAGDALQALAFETLASASVSGSGDWPERIVRALNILAKAIGPLGMVGGQTMDLAFEGASPSLDQIFNMERKKTGYLMGCCLGLGATLGGATESLAQELESRGRGLGLAFQMIDDQLNVIGDPKLMGKNVGTDAKKAKATAASRISPEQTTNEVLFFINQAIETFRSLNSPKLEWLARYIYGRSS